MFDLVRADLERAARMNGFGAGRRRKANWVAYLAEIFGNPGTQAVLVYRFGHWAWKCRVPGLRHLLLALYVPLRLLSRGFGNVNIPVSAKIGPGMLIHTWGGVFVPPCDIGRNVYFQHGVVVTWRCLGIGDDVYFGPGAKVIKPVRIGDRARIGANAVVVDDVPDDCTVAGIPARVVKRHEGEAGWRPKDTHVAEDVASGDVRRQDLPHLEPLAPGEGRRSGDEKECPEDRR